MKKLFVILVLIAFFAPCFTPLANSGTEKVEVCSVSMGPECTHGDLCPMNKGKSKTGKKGLKDGKSQKCDKFYECQSKSDADEHASLYGDIVFITPSASNTAWNHLTETLVLKPFDGPQNPSISLPERPPALS